FNNRRTPMKGNNLIVSDNDFSIDSFPPYVGSFDQRSARFPGSLLNKRNVSITGRSTFQAGNCLNLSNPVYSRSRQLDPRYKTTRPRARYIIYPFELDHAWAKLNSSQAF